MLLRTMKMMMEFQSTLPRRERRNRPIYGARFHRFQSTLPRRERLPSLYIASITSYFNPRSHVGSDHDRRDYILQGLHFNPRSHVGSDNLPYGLKLLNGEFQSTLPRRERLLSL